MTKLPVWATIMAAYATLWVQRRPLLRYAALPLVLIVAIEVAFQRLGPEGDPLHSAATALLIEIAIDEATWLLSSIIMIAFAVPFYRVLLLGQTSFPTEEIEATRRAYFGMLAVTVLLAALYDWPTALIDRLFLSDAPQIGVLAQIGLTFGFVWLTTKLAFLFPIICLGKPWNLMQRWRETSGNFWRLAVALLAALLPLLAVFVLWAAVVGFWDETWNPVSTPSTLLEPVATTAVWLAAEALAIAVTVLAFAHLTGYPAKGVRALPPAPHPQA